MSQDHIPKDIYYHLMLLFHWLLLGSIVNNFY